MSIKGVRVGETLFTVAEKRDGGTVLGDGLTVTTVGRRWVTAVGGGQWGYGHRFDIPTGHEEHPHAYRRVTAFRTEAEAVAYVADIQLRAELRPAIYRHIVNWPRWPTDLQVRLRDLIEEAEEAQS